MRPTHFCRIGDQWRIVVAYGRIGLSISGSGSAPHVARALYEAPVARLGDECPTDCGTWRDVRR